MPVKFLFLVLPHVHLMDLAGPDQVIYGAIEYGADFKIEYCAVEEDITTSAGLPIGKLKHFSEIKLHKGDYFIIPGAETDYLLSPDFTKHEELFLWINRQYETGVNICSICTGAFGLACSGLLDGIPSTTHFSKTKHLQKQYPALKVNENVLFTVHKGIYTSAGITSGIDMFLHIVEDLKGAYFAHLIARELVVYNRRTASHNQQSELLSFRNHIHAGIHNVQDWLHNNLNKKTNITELSEIANMSSRNFTRIFKKETGITVNGYLTILRKNRIKDLIKNPDLSRIQIAKKCGLKSTRQVSRILKTIT